MLLQAAVTVAAVTVAAGYCGRLSPRRPLPFRRHRCLRCRPLRPSVCGGVHSARAAHVMLPVLLHVRQHPESDGAELVAQHGSSWFLKRDLECTHKLWC